MAPASLKGDHFASVMFHVVLTFGRAGDGSDQRKMSMIVKTLPPEGTAKADILSDEHIFENELKLYTTLIPRFEEEWLRCGEVVQFSARLLYHSTLTPRPVLVLEDLCEAGYEVLRERPFNCDEVKLCLHKLSQWHAVSYKLASTQQDDAAAAAVSGMQHAIFKQSSVVGTDFISGGMQCLLDVLAEEDGFEEFLPQLRNLTPQLVERCVGLNDAFARGVAGPIYVLNHGDLHDRNIMVKRAAGRASEVVEMLFIDFQQSFFGPAAYDNFANFALFSSDLRSLKHEELFAFYVARFRENLAKLQVPEPWPDRADFEEDYKRWFCLELFMVSTFVPLMNSEVDFNSVFHSKAYRRRFYKTPEYLNYLRTLLPIYKEAGYFK